MTEASISGASLRARLQRLDLLHYLGSLGVRGVEVLGKLGLYFFAARKLGGYDSGLLFFCLTWVNLASAAARMGLERAMTRHIAADLAIGRGTQARRTLLVGMRGCLMGGVAWSALTFLLAGPAAIHLFTQPDLAGPLRLSALLLLPQTLVVGLGYILTGVKRGALGQLAYSSLPPVLVLAMILLGAHTLDQVMLGYAAAFLVTGILAALVIARDWRGMVDRPPPPDIHAVELPTLWRSAIPFLAVELVSISLISLPLLLLGAYAGPVEVGAFSVASRLSTLVWMVVISIGLIAAPRFAEHFRRHEFAALSALNRKSCLVAMVFALPPVAVMIAAPGFLLSIVGPNFDIGASALVILAIGQAFNALFPLQDMMLAMTGHGRTLRSISLVQLAVGVALGLLLIPRFGSVGAAVTTSACLALGALGTTLAALFLVPGSAWGPLRTLTRGRSWTKSPQSGPPGSD